MQQVLQILQKLQILKLFLQILKVMSERKTYFSVSAMSRIQTVTVCPMRCLKATPKVL